MAAMGVTESTDIFFIQQDESVKIAKKISIEQQLLSFCFRFFNSENKRVHV